MESSADLMPSFISPSFYTDLGRGNKANMHYWWICLDSSWTRLRARKHCRRRTFATSWIIQLTSFRKRWISVWDILASHGTPWTFSCSCSSLQRMPVCWCTGCCVQSQTCGLDAWWCQVFWTASVVIIYCNGTRSELARELACSFCQEGILTNIWAATNWSMAKTNRLRFQNLSAKFMFLYRCPETIHFVSYPIDKKEGWSNHWEWSNPLLFKTQRSLANIFWNGGSVK